jgi:glucose uptake protein GlcU
MGTADRIIRIVVAVVIGVLYFAGEITGLAATILGLLAIVFILTGVVGFCPLYAPFKFSTRKQTGAPSAKQV